MKNLEAARRQAGSSLEEVVQVTYVLPNPADFEPCWPVLRRYFGQVRPAAMMLAAGLADPRLKLEIAVTALTGSYGWRVPSGREAMTHHRVDRTSDAFKRPPNTTLHSGVPKHC